MAKEKQLAGQTAFTVIKQYIIFLQRPGCPVLLLPCECTFSVGFDLALGETITSTGGDWHCGALNLLLLPLNFKMKKC